MNYESISDDELRQILQNKDMYTKNAILEAINEMEKRKLDIPKGLKDEIVKSDKSDIWITGNDLWIQGCRIFACIISAIVLIFGVYYGAVVIQGDQTSLGILIIVSSVFIPLLLILTAMVFCNIAQDIAIVREMKQREYYKKR